MKHILSFIICLLGVSTFAQNNVQSVGLVNVDLGYPVNEVLTQSTPALLYTQGEPLKNWSLVTEAGDNIKVVYGSLGGYNEWTVDSVFVKSHALDWGLNSLDRAYKGSTGDNASPQSRKIIINTRDSRLVRIGDINPDDYDGDTRDNINNLYYTLYWLSNPKVQNTIAIPSGMTVAINSVEMKPVYEHKSTGFYAAIELSGAYSFGHGFHPASKDHNMGFFELDAVGGWMFNEQFKMGLGVGGRYYFAGRHIINHHFGLPLYLDMRGNFISYKTHKLVPFWIFDTGYTFPDGFMLRPQIGLKFGQPRQFTISLGYVAQWMRKYNYILNDAGYETTAYDGYKRTLFSSLSVKFGYEF